MNPIDIKIEKLFRLTDKFLFIEYYSHTRKYMFKILNEYTKFGEDKIVLGCVTDGIEKSLDLAIKHIKEAKELHN